MKTIPEPSWIFVIEESKLPENDLKVVFPKGLSILLIKKSGSIFAISNKCAHMACALGGGSLKDYTIKCPCHDWRYDIRTGEFLDSKEIRIPVYEQKLVDDKLFLKI